MRTFYRGYSIRDWQPQDREEAAALVRGVLQEYGLSWEPGGADRDVVEVERHYLQGGGAFWVVEGAGAKLVGTGAYYPSTRGQGAVEIRKMYLLPSERGRGLGSYLLRQLEQAIAAGGFTEIWLETATILQEAVRLYESHGYLPGVGVETARCDRVYRKILCRPRV